MAEPIHLKDLAYDQLDALVAEGLPLVIPTGSVEQHGPHLPLGTDTYIANGLAARVAEGVKCVLAPPVDYAAWSRPKSGGGRSYLGSIGIRPTTLTAVFKEIISEAIRLGFSKIAFINGHYENADPIFESLEELIGPGGPHSPERGGEVRAMLINWWELLTDQDVYGVFGDDFPGWPAEHAGVLETSLMETLRPDLVNETKKADGGAERVLGYEVFPTPPDTIWPNGIGSTALPASADLGAQTAEIVVSRAIAAIEKDLL